MRKASSSSFGFPKISLPAATMVSAPMTKVSCGVISVRCSSPYVFNMDATSLAFCAASSMTTSFGSFFMMISSPFAGQTSKLRPICSKSSRRLGDADAKIICDMVKFPFCCMLLICFLTLHKTPIRLAFVQCF